MKKLLLLFALAVMAFTGQVQAYDCLSGRSVSLDFDGSIKDDVVEKCYMKAINRSGGTLAAGSLVVWDTANDDGASVTTSTTAGANPACIYVESCADDAACKCQVSGLYDSVLFDSDNHQATAGNSAYLSENNAGYVQGEATPVVTDHVVGMFYDSASASASVELMIQLKR